MENSVKKMREVFLYRLSKFLSTFILRKSHIATSNLRISSCFQTTHSTWRWSTSDFPSTTKRTWNPNSSQRTRTNWLEHHITSLQKWLSWATTRDAIYGQREWFCTFWWQQHHHLMERMMGRFWGMCRSWVIRWKVKVCDMKRLRHRGWVRVWRTWSERY